MDHSQRPTIQAAKYGPPKDAKLKCIDDDDVYCFLLPFHRLESTVSSQQRERLTLLTINWNALFPSPLATHRAVELSLHCFPLGELSLPNLNHFIQILPRLVPSLLFSETLPVRHCRHKIFQDIGIFKSSFHQILLDI